MEFHITNNNHGRLSLTMTGYHFHKDRELQNGNISWRCATTSTSRKSRLHTNAEIRTIPRTNITTKQIRGPMKDEFLSLRNIIIFLSIEGYQENKSKNIGNAENKEVSKTKKSAKCK